MFATISYRFIQILTWIPIVGFSLIIAYNSIDMIHLDTSSGFLAEKQEALQVIGWKPSFVIHLLFGIPCLLLPIGQFSKRMLKNNPKLHSNIGKAYTYTTLFLVAPTGMYMSFWAKEGLWSTLGFFITGVALSITTLKGLTTFKNGNLKGHVEWMTRSYAVATSAITFRLLHLYFHSIGLEYHFNYILSIWMSLLINLLLAEFSILYLNHKFFKSKSS